MKKLDSLLNDKYTYLHNGDKRFGCNLSFECQGMNVIFYNIKLDKIKKTLFISGRTFKPRFLQDSIAILGVELVLGVRRGDSKLKHVRVLGTTNLLNGKRGAVFSDREGDFYLTFPFSKSDKLYFSDPSFRLLEYNIGKLLE